MKRLSQNIKEKIKPKKRLPTFLTLMNAALGFFAILAIIEGNFRLASLLIVLGFVFDALDGAVARYLHTTSDCGLELDSLADAVTFVIAPALLIYFRFFDTFRMGSAVALFAIICGISRLAKFNTLKGVHGIDDLFVISHRSLLGSLR